MVVVVYEDTVEESLIELAFQLVGCFGVGALTVAETLQCALQIGLGLLKVVLDGAARSTTEIAC